MKHISTLCSFILFSIFSVTVNAQTTIYYVSAANGDDANNGTASTTPYKTLQKAITSMKANTNPGVEILLEGGVYKPTDGTANITNRDEIFSLFRNYFDNAGKSLKVYGGYNFTSGTRDVINNPSYLDGDIGTADPSDNSYHLIGIANLQPSTDSLIIDGITIRNGNANGTGLILLTDNAAISRNQGAGVNLLDCENGNKLQFINCVFTSNASSLDGGAVYMAIGSPIYKDCVFDGNSCNNLGGAVRVDFGSPGHTSSPTFINSVFYNNNAPWGGSGIMNAGSKDAGDLLTVINCSFAGNLSSSALNHSSGTANLYNTIIWGNASAITVGDFDSPVLNASNCDIQGGFTGTAIISINPLFLNVDNGKGSDGVWMTSDDGLNLTNCSPAKDAGNNSFLPAEIITDIKDSIRIENSIVDMGAYETKTSGTVNTAYRDADMDAFGDPNSSITYTCQIPMGYVSNNNDCDDTKNGVNPNAAEICGNGIDDNCNGQVDENCGVTVSIQNASVTEGTKGKPAAMIFVISLNKPAITKCSVQYVTSNSSAIAGVDYKLAKGTVSFSKGQTSKTFSVTIEGDKLVEGIEDFFVTLSKPVNLSLGTAIAVGTIIDDDGLSARSIAKTETDVTEIASLKIPNLLHRSQVWSIPSLPAQNTVVVTDMNGRTIMKTSNYRNTYSFTNAASGMYIYQIQVADKKSGFKMYTGRILVTD